MKSSEIELSEYGQASTTASPVNQMMAEFAAWFRPDRDINLGVGYVNADTIPADRICEATEYVVKHPEKHKQPLNYGSPAGSENLIKSIKNYYIKNKTGGVTARLLGEKEIIIGATGATSLLESIAHLLKPGIVITSDPMYYIYCNFLERMGFKIIAVAEDEEGIQTAQLHDRIKSLGPDIHRLSFFYIVSIGNPTCTILSNRRRQELVEIATALSLKLGRKIPLIVDKAYEDLLHDSSVEKPCSALLHDRTGIVYEIGTLSKILSPALRIGYMIGENGPFMRAMVQKTSDTGFSAPLITQEIASYMLDRKMAGQIKKVNQGYREKAKTVNQWMKQELSEFIQECKGGRAGFYFYLTLKNIKTHEGSDFFRFLARTTGSYEIDGPDENKKPRVIYIPGNFCVHPNGRLVEKGEMQLRLSYGFETTERIKTAINLIKKACEYSRSRA